MNWYEVRTSLPVRARSEQSAIDQVAEALRAGFAGSGLYPVGTFEAAEIPPPRGTAEEIAARDRETSP